MFSAFSYSLNDLEQLQEVVRAIRRAGGKINRQCGIHIHIDAEPFDGRKLGNLAKVVYKQEPLILHALGINRERLRRYTRPVSDEATKWRFKSPFGCSEY